MDKKEQKELRDKILNVDMEPKRSRVATTVFINKSSKEEARVFLDYLDHSSTAVKKMARYILGQKGIVEAVDKLIAEFYNIVDSLTFMPDAEYKEKHYYTNLIEILETLFAIIKSENLKNEELFSKIVEIFKRTKSEDLRFTMIKLIGILGDRLDYFMKIYDDLTEKERRALYYVYTQVEHPRRLEVFKKGLTDDRNFEYVIANMLNFEQGKKALSEQFLNMGSYNKQTVLKKLQEGKYPEFNDVLIKMLSDKNKFLVELATENLKNSITGETSLQPFIDMIETGYSPDGISGALEIIAHFVKRHPEDIYLQGLEKQPSHKNKNIILEFLIKKLKTDIKITEKLTDKILPKLLVYFDNYSKEKEELFISIFKIIAALRFPDSGKVKGVKKKFVGFKKEYDTRLSTRFRNNFAEFMVKLNQQIGRFEESESKIKNIVVLFDIDPLKIEHARMLKLKEQLASLEFLDEDTGAKLVRFLARLAGLEKIDWKIKTVVLDLLAQYGGASEIPVLTKVIETETSLAVKVNAEKALKIIEEKRANDMEPVLVMEPLFYLQKMLNEFFASKLYKVNVVTETTKFSETLESSESFKYLVVSENVFTPELSQEAFDYLDEHPDSTLIIITADLQKMAAYQDLPGVKYLKKPFNQEVLKQLIPA
ncbi:MAG: hypothetical protein JSV88_04900 [Candidatus Aminicenantes bacterium]|nr:MAG: hypothetical protein JSV88_04900 [Candidatus Aminicenantes bacterium]